VESVIYSKLIMQDDLQIHEQYQIFN